MRRTIMFLFALAVLLTAPFMPAIADIYQYIDENGVLHFTNVDGAGKNHRRVVSETAAPRESEARPKSRRTVPSSVSRTGIPNAYLDIINSACNRHGVDPSLVHAIVQVESGYDPYALSRKGAMGLMQLMPQTAVNMNIKNSFNPTENIDGGVRYLRYLIDQYEGNLSLALAAYNSGETAIKRWGTVPPFRETQNYVKRILQIYNGGTNRPFVTRYTVYMGYGEDGALLITDNPSNHRDKKLKRKTQKNL